MGHNKISTKRKKIIAVSICIKKLERFFTTNLTAQLKVWEKKEQAHPRVDSRKWPNTGLKSTN